MDEAQLDLYAAAECLLFVSRDPVPVSRLAEVLGVPSDDIPELMAELDQRLAGHGLHLAHLAGGYALATRPEFAEMLRVFLQPTPDQLSRQALETLAIVAYQQPATRPQIEQIRGVNSASVLRVLLDKQLVAIAGREKAPGRPYRFVTTSQFLSLFGLASLDELPPLSEEATEALARSLSQEEQRPPIPEEEEEKPFEFKA